MNRRSMIAPLVGSAMILLALTGCTSDGSSGEESQATKASAGTESQQRDKWNADYRSCLSQAGFELPTDGQVDFGGRQADYEKASATCEKNLGPMPGNAGDMSAEEKAALRAAITLEQKCFRDLGYTVNEIDFPGIEVPEKATEEDMNKCIAAGEAEREKVLKQQEK